jgi:hypothetical protein
MEKYLAASTVAFLSWPGEPCPGHLRFNGGGWMAGTAPGHDERAKTLLHWSPYPYSYGDTRGHDGKATPV